jgi:hypothetical protein
MASPCAGATALWEGRVPDARIGANACMSPLEGGGSLEEWTGTHHASAFLAVFGDHTRHRI